MIYTKKQKYFLAVKTLIYEVCLEVYTWNFLKKKLNTKQDYSIFNMRPYFWIPVIGSLQQSFLLNLANLLDRKMDDVVSMDTLFDKIFDKTKEQEIRKKQGIKKQFDKKDIKLIIDNILKRRHKNAGHKDIKFTLGDRSLEKEYYLGDREINKVLNLLIKILETVRGYANMNGSSYISEFKELKKKCEKDAKFMFDSSLYYQSYKRGQN